MNGVETPDSGPPDAGPRTRLFVEAALGEGAAVALGEAEAHRLRHVLRLKAGDAVALFNGRDGEWRARVDGFARGSGALTVFSRRRSQEPTPDLWLLFAPIKRARLDYLVEKATELGVSALWPVLTRRTAVARVNAGRLQAHAVAAAEQSGRLSVPQVMVPEKLERVLSRWPQDHRIVLCDESSAGRKVGGVRPIAGALAEAAGGAGAERGKWALLTGPEGGFDRSELDALKKLPFVTAVGLGPRILRADTAALAALACWQALAGDWRER